MTKSVRRRRAEPRKPTRRLPQADRKRELLTHAKQLFLSLGYHATTTEKIAQAADVTEPVLYRHFDDKKALFLEVLREIRETALLSWQGELARQADPLAKLHAIAGAYLGSTREHAAEFRVLHRSVLETQDAEVASFLRAFYLDCETLLAHVIAEGQQGGQFRSGLDPRVGAWEVIRTALAYTLTLPLGIPLYEEPDYAPAPSNVSWSACYASSKDHVLLVIITTIVENLATRKATG
jgi:AcrR family transcriptional regulator